MIQETNPGNGGDRGLTACRNEQAALDAVVTIPCSADRLADVPFDASRIFTDPTVASLWRLAERELNALAIPDQTGGVNPGDRRALFSLAAFFKPSRVLEIGTHIGASTTHLATALKAASASSLVTVDIVDVNDDRARPWLTYGAARSPREMLAALGCERLVTFVQSDGKTFLRGTAERFDMIFIDGDHHAAATYQELALALSRLSPGGLIVLHDYYPHAAPLWRESAPIVGPFLAAERVSAEGCALRVVPLGELPWPTKHQTRLTSLALVVRSHGESASGVAGAPSPLR